MRTLRPSYTRYVLTLTALAFVAIASPPAHADGWWPGGGDKETDSTEASEEASDESAMVDSSMFKLSWPKIEMPKFAWKPGVADGETSAVSPEGNPISRALDKVADTSKRASDNVRGAWSSAIEKLSFGGDETDKIAKNDKPGFWSRMFAPEEPRGSETVQEFIAQERVGMTR